MCAFLSMPYLHQDMHARLHVHIDIHILHPSLSEFKVPENCLVILDNIGQYKLVTMSYSINQSNSSLYNVLFSMLAQVGRLDPQQLLLLLFTVTVLCTKYNNKGAMSAKQYTHYSSVMIHAKMLLISHLLIMNGKIII